jgi:eukaryotic translation initiation factor 2C
VIKKFTWERNPKYAREGVHAKNFFFPLKDQKKDTPEMITVYDYFWRKYNIRLEYWYLPLIETTRAGYFPMELCILQPNQKYQYKLSPDQTASMIKFAVTRPRERLAAIQHGVGMLKWHTDPYLKYFGVQIDPNLTITQARLLQPPEVQYTGSKATPGTSGRWDLRGKKFLLPNEDPLVSWGVCVVGGCTNEPSKFSLRLDQFLQELNLHQRFVTSSVSSFRHTLAMVARWW